MKKKYLSALSISAMLSIISFSCGNSSVNVETEEKNKITDSNSASNNAPKVNTNLALNLKEVNNDLLGCTIGLPEGWSLVENSEMFDIITWSIKRGNTEVIYIESSRTKQENPGLTEMSGKWKNAEKYNILEKDDNVAFDGGTRTGLVVWKKKADDKAREIVFDYFLTLNSSKISFAKFYPADKTYNCNSIDTCIAIIKSIKLKK